MHRPLGEVWQDLLGVEAVFFLAIFIRLLVLSETYL